MTGAATDVQLAGLPRGAAGQGRDRRRGRRARRHDAPACDPDRRSGCRGRRRRHRRRSPAHRQHLDDGRAGRRRGRAPCGQARQPGGVVGVGSGRRPGGAGCPPGLSPAQRVAQLAGEVGITFCFAQLFHPAFRHAAVARRELGVPTAFNFLGPLTNPAQPSAAAVGVADDRMAPIVAGVLSGRGGDGPGVPRGRRPRRALDGLDLERMGGLGGRGRTAVAGPRPPRRTRGDPGGPAGRRRHPQRRRRPGPACRPAGPGPRRGAPERGGSPRGDRCPRRGRGARRAAVQELEDRLAAALQTAADAVDDGRAAATLDRWVQAAQR